MSYASVQSYLLDLNWLLKMWFVNIEICVNPHIVRR